MSGEHRDRGPLPEYHDVTLMDLTLKSQEFSGRYVDVSGIPLSISWDVDGSLGDVKSRRYSSFLVLTLGQEDGKGNLYGINVNGLRRDYVLAEAFVKAQMHRNLLFGLREHILVKGYFNGQCLDIHVIHTSAGVVDFKK